MFVLPLSRTVARRAVIAPSFDRLVDRLFDESFDRFIGGSAASTRTPAMDVSESDAAYTIAFDVPGATREQLKVSIDGRRVSLTTVAEQAETSAADDKAAKAEMAEGADADNAKTRDRVLYRERVAPSFARTVSLPAEVDQQASQAKFENGVLTLVLVKKIKPEATQLQIA